MVRHLFWLALSIPLVAQAQDPVCDAAVLDVLPGAGATDVPPNARILVEVTGHASCHDGLELRLVEAGKQIEVTRRDWEVPGGRAYVLQPTAPLSAGVEHTVEVLGLDGRAGHGELHRFTTGHVDAQPTTGTTRLRLYAARYEATSDGDALYEIDLDVAPTHDVRPFDRVLVTIEDGSEAPDDEAAYAVAIRPDQEGWATTLTLLQRATANREVCVVARQQDVSGQWSLPTRACILAAETYVEADADRGGCRATPSTPGAAWFFLLPLLVLRRRREPSICYAGAMAIGTVSNARSALQLAGTQLNASAHNTANALTEGFKRLRVDAETGPNGGVRARVSQAERPGPDLVADTIDRISATTLYEANLTVLAVDNALKGELLDTLG